MDKVLIFIIGVLLVIGTYIAGILLGGLLWGVILYAILKIIGIGVVGGYVVTFQLTFVVGVLITLIKSIISGGGRNRG